MLNEPRATKQSQPHFSKEPLSSIRISRWLTPLWLPCTATLGNTNSPSTTSRKRSSGGSERAGEAIHYKPLLRLFGRFPEDYGGISACCPRVSERLHQPQQSRPSLLANR